MFNQDLREDIKKSNLKLWQVAELLGIRDTELSKKLRKELSNDEKDKIRNLIKNL